MANRYIELICEYQHKLERELTLEEIQTIKMIVAEEFDYFREYDNLLEKEFFLELEKKIS